MPTAPEYPLPDLQSFNEQLSSSGLTIMLAQRLFLRAGAPLSRCAGSPIFRHTLQRRLASSGGQPPLTGAADNAFNRERLAVKQHAAESSGELSFSLRVGI